VLWTHSNCERLVYEQLRAQDFEMLLPMIGQWVRRRGLRCLAQVPMFPGYLFMRHAIDKTSYLQVCKSRGLVRILGEQWDRLATVPDREIEAIQALVQTDLPALPHPYLRVGQRVRVIRGPLANAEGILVKSEPEKGLLVLSVELLRRSVGVEIDCTLVQPV
jgi:transcriptional antiterminator NusG